VRPGDTPSTIAERTGVPLEDLEALNPDIDPQQLTPGQRLRLRR
jgi:LysM repeat protein